MRSPPCGATHPRQACQIFAFLLQYAMAGTKVLRGYVTCTVGQHVCKLLKMRRLRGVIYFVVRSSSFCFFLKSARVRHLAGAKSLLLNHSRENSGCLNFVTRVRTFVFDDRDAGISDDCFCMLSHNCLIVGWNS